MRGTVWAGHPQSMVTAHTHLEQNDEHSDCMVLGLCACGYTFLGQIPVQVKHCAHIFFPLLRR